VRSNPDLITAKLPALQFYQLAIPAPARLREASIRLRQHAARRIQQPGEVFDVSRAADLYRAGLEHAHTAAEIGIDDFQAKRSPDERYRTAPLKGLWTHQKGGFYHDGRFARLRDVVDHYNSFLGTNLTEQQKADLVEYLKSL
jgi:cytochrome c peroxidase